MNNKVKLPSGWQNGDKVQVVFPSNGKLQGKIIKVSFKEHGEPIYDVEVPYANDPHATGDDFPGDPEFDTKGFFRLHSVPQWFISYTQEAWDKMRAEEVA